MKSFRQLMRDQEQKDLIKRENRVVKVERKALAHSLPDTEYITMKETQSLIPDFIARGWETVAMPGFSSRTYTLRIPRSVLEERYNG